MAEQEYGASQGYVEPGLSDPDKVVTTPGGATRRGPLPTKQDWPVLLYRMDRAQHDRIERRLVEHRVNQRRRDGEMSVWVYKRQDMGQWDVYTPPGSSKAPIPIYNKSARLCARLGSYVMADPPQPLVSPTRDDDASKDAATVAQRALDQIIGPDSANLEEHLRRAIDRCHVSGTAYLVFRVDTYAGGQQPVEIDAHPEAATPAEATRGPGGLPHPKDQLQRRFVQTDEQGAETLGDDEAKADTQWRPAIVVEVLPAAHVLFTPGWTPIHAAHGVLVREYLPWGQLKLRYPDLLQMPEETVRSLCEHRPKGWRELLPLRNGKPVDPKKTETTPLDDLLCAHLRWWARECPEYPEGKHIALLGKDQIAANTDWSGVDSKGRFRLELPIVPVQLFRKETDPWGSEALMDSLGPAGEARGAVAGMMFDYLDKLGRRKVFVPQTSIYSGKEALLDYLTYVPMNPGGEPHYEEIPPMPQEIPQIFAQLTSEMDDASTLNQVAQGAETPDATSGRAKLAVISQVQANLSDAQNFIRQACLRSWNLCLHLARKFYTVPQTTEWVGEDAEYQLTRWMGSDLVGAHDLDIKPGTGTMMSDQQKQDKALALQQAGVLQLPDVLEAIGGSMDAMLGLRDNPHRHRIRRQIRQWEQGPPDGQIQQPPPPPPPPPAPPTVDPTTGMPVPAAPPAPPAPMGPQADPRSLAIFAPIPVDIEPAVATWRGRELGRAMAGVRYAGLPKEWQLGLDQAYMTAMHALQPPPPNPLPGAQQEAPPPSPAASPALTPAELQMGNLPSPQATGSMA